MKVFVVSKYDESTGCSTSEKIEAKSEVDALITALAMNSEDVDALSSEGFLTCEGLLKWGQSCGTPVEVTEIASMKLYVYGTADGVYYQGKEPSGCARLTSILETACFFTEQSKDYAEDCIALGYNLYSIDCSGPMLEQRFEDTGKKVESSKASIDHGVRKMSLPH